MLSRSTFAEYYERNRINYEAKEHLYKRRQAIVEHPYGTLKRQLFLATGLGKEKTGTAGSCLKQVEIYLLRKVIRQTAVRCN
jgi:hypothetical protein